MKKRDLQHKYFKTRFNETWKASKLQRNFCCRLYMLQFCALAIMIYCYSKLNLAVTIVKIVQNILKTGKNNNNNNNSPRLGNTGLTSSRG